MATVSLSTMRQSVKTLFSAMSYVVDLVVHLLKCLPNLENLFAQVMILTPNEKVIPCIVQHSLHLKKLILHFVCNVRTLCLGMLLLLLLLYIHPYLGKCSTNWLGRGSWNLSFILSFHRSWVSFNLYVFSGRKRSWWCKKFLASQAPCVSQRTHHSFKDSKAGILWKKREEHWVCEVLYSECNGARDHED